MRMFARSTNGLYWRNQRNPMTGEMSGSSGVNWNPIEREWNGHGNFFRPSDGSICVWNEGAELSGG